MVEAQTFKYLKNVDGEYQFVTEEIPKPAAGQVLIKIAYSTVNPVDKYMLHRFKPTRLGSDGSGTIVEVGEGVSADLVGKKVAFIYEAWG